MVSRIDNIHIIKLIVSHQFVLSLTGYVVQSQVAQVCLFRSFAIAVIVN